jgi:hypothetical protein
MIKHYSQKRVQEGRLTFTTSPFESWLEPHTVFKAHGRGWHPSESTNVEERERRLSVANSKLCIHEIDTSRGLNVLKAAPPVAHPSRCHRRLIQSIAVRLPSIRTDTRADASPIRARFGRALIQRRMCGDSYSTVGNRGASSRDQRPSRRGCGPHIHAESCQSAVQRRDARVARTAPS